MFKYINTPILPNKINNGKQYITFGSNSFLLLNIINVIIPIANINNEYPDNIAPYETLPVLNIPIIKQIMHAKSNPLYT
jgi:hypothetical protein